MNKHIHHTIEQVPTNYYQRGIRNNLLQRLWHTNKLNVVLSFIPDIPKKILDVGCASGWFISEIAKKNPKTQCYGVDIYGRAIEYGEKNYPNIKFSLADAHVLPFKKDSFDLVICTEVLEHLDNPQDALMEIRRVLKKGATAIIELDSASLLFSITWFIWRKFYGKVWNDSHLHSFNIKKLERMILNCGFEILDRRKFNFGMAMAFCIRKK